MISCSCGVLYYFGIDCYIAEQAAAPAPAVVEKLTWESSNRGIVLRNASILSYRLPVVSSIAIPRRECKPSASRKMSHQNERGMYAIYLTRLNPLGEMRVVSCGMFGLHRPHRLFLVGVLPVALFPDPSNRLAVVAIFLTPGLGDVIARMHIYYTRCSFEGPDWGYKSTGAQRAACLRAMGQAIEDDKDVSEGRGD